LYCDEYWYISLKIISHSITFKVELHGADGFGGPIFIGTCCFLRRDALCSNTFIREYKNGLNDENENDVTEVNLHGLEEESKTLANCTYETNTVWGKKVIY